MDKDPYLELIKPGAIEKEITCTFQLSEPVVVSLDTVADALSMKKKVLVDRLLDVGLENLCKAIYETRPDLMIDDPSPEDPSGKAHTALTPSHIREVRKKYGGAIQFDLEEESEREAS